MKFTLTKVAAAALVAATLAGSIGEASARPGGGPHYRHHRGGIGPGAAIAGAALGIAGLAAAGAAANHYYNGYPAYSYGPGYNRGYGYDYIPDRGYYGPY